MSSETVQGSRRGLLAGAIGFGGDFIASLACSGPTTGVAYALATFLALSGLASPLVVLTAGIIVLLVAIGYARLNRWRADAGAPYVWVGRVIAPPVGFAVGMLAIAIGFIVNIGNITLAGSYLLGILSPGTTFSALIVWITAAIYMALVVFIAVRGIRLSIQVQTSILVAEYLIVGAFAVAALVYEIAQHPEGTSAPSLAYFSIGSSPTGWTGFAMALVIGGFLFGGWEAPLLFSEESKNPNLSPGRAAIVGVIATLAWYLLLFIIFQGVASVKNLGEHGADVLGYASTLLAPDPIARLLPLAVFSALFAATQMQLTEASRVMFSMAQDGLLPKVLAKLHPRFRTPWVASLILGLLPPLVLIPYLVSSGAGTVIVDIIGSVGLFYLAMYTVIPFACVVYAGRALRGKGDFWSSTVPPLIGGVAMLLLFIYGLFTLPFAATIVAGIVLAICVVLGIAAALTSKSEYFKQTDVSAPSPGEVLASGID
jgi:amino acid transporter